MNFYLCNYPFLFDAKAKLLLLETDQSIQMGMAMHNAAANSALNAFLNLNVTASPFVVLEVSRLNLVQDTIREIQFCSKGDLKKPLKVKFHGEEAEDAGSFWVSHCFVRDFPHFVVDRRRTERILHVVAERPTGSQIRHVQGIRRLACHLVLRSFV